MAFIGNTNTTQAFTPAIDTFSGNGSTVAFTLSRPVASVAQVQVNISNVPQNPSDAYTVSGNTITFTSAPLSGTNNIYVYYTSPITQVITPGQSTVGTTQIQSGVTINFADGSAAAPSITNDGDTNTGIFFPAADTIAFSEGGAESMRIDSSGNMGIGTALPAYPLTLGNNKQFGALNTAGSAVPLAILNGSNNLVFGDDSANTGTLTIQSRGSTLFSLNGSERMRLSAAGTLSLNSTGTSGNSEKLHIQAATLGTTAGNTAYWQSLFGPDVSNTTTYSIFNYRFANGSSHSSAEMRIQRKVDVTDQGYIGWRDSTCFTTGYGNTEYARMDTNGYLMVGKTGTGNSGTIQSKALGSTGFDTYQGFSSAGVFTFAVSGAGTVYAVVTAIQSISDIRWKENIRDLDSGLTDVMALKPRLYDWKEGKGANSKNVRGFIAQEFEEVFPDLVGDWREPAPEGEEPYKSIRQDLIPTLVKAIQEQQALIQSLTDRLTALENR